MKTNIIGLSHIALYIKDLEVTKKFYTEVLGFEILGQTTWEGDTLVIEVTNFHPSITTFHPMTSFSGSGATLHLTERYTRTGPDEMRYEVTVNDPATFERPYTAVLDMAAGEAIYEYACHEGNVQVRNYITASRAGRLGTLSAEQLEEGGD